MRVLPYVRRLSTCSATISVEKNLVIGRANSGLLDLQAHAATGECREGDGTVTTSIAATFDTDMGPVTFGSGDWHMVTMSGVTYDMIVVASWEDFEGTASVDYLRMRG